MNRVVRRGIYVCAVAFCLLVIGTAGVSATTDSLSGSELDSQGVSIVAQDDETDTNVTDRHRNPNEHSEDDDDQLGDWLSDQLSDRLSDGAVEISEGQYESARELLGDDYEEQVDQYIEVTDTDEEGEETLRDTADEQERLAELREEFEETQAAYEEALEAGDTDRARELARELVRLSEEIDEVSVELSELLSEIEAAIDDDLDDINETVKEVSTETTTQAESVAESEFLETTLTAELTDERMSFLDPSTLTGQLRTADGEPVANESIQIRSMGENMTVTTNAEGTFTEQFLRPTDIPLPTDSLSVEYVPATGSVYLGSNTSVNVTIEQVEPSLTVRPLSETAQFGDSLPIQGELTAQSVPVDNVTVSVTVDEQQIGTVHVTDGSFNETVELPATVTTGEQQLSVQLPFEEQALESVSDNQTVDVAATGTSVSMNATRLNANEIQVNATLMTVDGVAIGGEPVQLRIDSQTVDTVTTDADGRLTETVSLPGPVDDSDVQITASYEAVGVNLAPAQDETQIAIQSGAEPTGSGFSLIWLGLGAVGLVALFGGFWWYRRETSDDSSGPTIGENKGGADPPAPVQSEVSASLVEHASNLLRDEKQEPAVEASYAAVRRQLEPDLGDNETLTHWEFYRACLEKGENTTEDFTDALRAVTESYEHAIYDVDEISTAQARDVLQHAREICEEPNRSGMQLDD